MIKLTGEDKVKKFLRTLSPQEKLELVEEVRRMIEFRDLDRLEKKKEKPSIEFNFMDGYY